MSEQRLRLGDMLMQAGLISEAQLGEALQSQKASGRKLGAELVALGFVNEVQMTQILSNQLSVPWVSLYHVEFTRELLSLIPAQVAESCCAIPVYIRKVRREGDTIFVAMDDPTNEQAIQLLRDATQLPVKPMVAAPSEILDAIGVYYFGKRPRTVAPPPPPDSEETEVQPAESAEPAAKAPPATEEEPATEAKNEPAPKQAGPKFLTLTLLDGTTVRLPAPGSGGATPEEERHVTAGDLVSALLARGRGEEAAGAPEDAWQTLFGTLLALLIRKGLIADWEFIDELTQNREGPE